MEGNRSWSIEDFDGLIILKPMIIKIPLFNKKIYFNFDIISVLNKLSPNLIILTPWSEPALHLAAYWASKKKIPCVAWLMGIRDYHWSIKYKIRGICSFFLLSRLLKNCNFIFAYGSSVRSALLKYFRYPSEQILIGNHCINEINYSLDNSSISRVNFRNKIGVRVNEYLFLYVGQLIERKGFHVLIRSLSYLTDLNSKFSLLVIGDGPLVYLINSFEYKDKFNIIHLKYLSDLEFLEAYSASDCTIVPSLFDDWSHVVNESFCFGIPVIASTGAYAARDLITEGHNGVLVPPNCSEKLAGAMRLALHDSAKFIRMGENGKALISNARNFKSAVKLFSNMALSLIK
jgi:glycosyltransferase involved in cell wall biosynthesis